THSSGDRPDSLDDELAGALSLRAVIQQGSPLLEPGVAAGDPHADAAGSADQVRYGGWTRAQIGLPLPSVSRIRATSRWPGRKAASMSAGSTSTSRILA